jgi:molecular chaperone IbpA
MVNKHIALFNALRPVSLGFDDLFDHFENVLEGNLNSSFPFYNIVKGKDNKYTIELALAGYSKKDIEINFENNILTVKSVKEEYEKNIDVLYKGIAKRYFSKAFTIADDVVVKDAELKDGLLKIDLEKIVPESKKARVISVK